ncbi:hypothetical protein [Streptomyces parvulus]|uniref:Uncharacterized protein n=1 Tax=Streptomyces parvulus TaxID=146923 RepID=A0A191US57_9ACTN|nr:hypothetical protein [Streptomyces parvulus]ANJ05538.1 hypothetical protein Spa2297_00190 [Streptomyces parvulus]GGR96534.1 hypothetical protein GCM10010220_56330 [Streptomyces parvulus]
MIESLAAVATAASTTLVAAMATDAWGAARSGLLRLFRRGEGPEEGAMAALLESEAALVAEAEDAEAARRQLAPAWRLRLEQFLRAHPEVADEVRELTRRLEDELPARERHWVQHVEARDHGQAFGAQGGNVIVHQEPGAGRGDRAT